jgi:hypothetical protein
LEECRRGKTRRLIINLPRSLKSHCASIHGRMGVMAFIA